MGLELPALTPPVVPTALGAGPFPAVAPACGIESPQGSLAVELNLKFLGCWEGPGGFLGSMGSDPLVEKPM